MTASVALLDPAQAAFIQSQVSIIVAASDAEQVPSLMRAAGCRVDAGRRRVTVLLNASQSRALLRGIDRSGVIAVVFSQPSTHRTLQLKGSDAAIETLCPADTALLEHYRELMVVEIGALGFPRVFTEAMLSGAAADTVAVSFTPAAVFEQTPGPAAGAQLPAAATP